jgi:transcriptional regulator with XRE-family HTH domain
MNRRDEEFAVEMGIRLRRARGSVGMSQEELARRAGLHRTTIGMIERGKRRMGSETLILILGALGIDPNKIIGGIEWIPGPAAPTGTWNFNSPQRRG